MAPITEITLKDPASADGFIPTSKLTAELSGQPGFRRIRSTRMIEDGRDYPSRTFAEWDSVEAHAAHQAAHQGAVQEISAKEPKSMHVDFSRGTSVIDILDKKYGADEKTLGVIEVLNTYFPVSHFASDGIQESKIEQEINKFLKKVAEINPAPPGLSGMTAMGWAVEDVDFKAAGAAEDEEPEKCRMLVVTIGWDSKASHDMFRESDVFKNSIHILRDLPKKGMEMFHVSVV